MAASQILTTNLVMVSSRDRYISLEGQFCLNSHKSTAAYQILNPCTSIFNIWILVDLHCFHTGLLCDPLLVSIFLLTFLCVLKSHVCNDEEYETVFYVHQSYCAYQFFNLNISAVHHTVN